MSKSELTVENADLITESLHIATGMPVEVADAEGNIISSEGYTCSDCGLCRAAGRSEEDCIRVHNYSAMAAEKSEGRSAYVCPMGLTCITSPVLSSSGRVARLTVGPLLLEDREDFLSYDLNQAAVESEPGAVRGVLDNIGVWAPEKASAISVLLVHSAAFLSETLGCENFLSGLDAGDISGWQKENKIDLKKTVSDFCSYIEENYSSDISLFSAARMYGMSTSYLCRIFKKEKGVTVNAYINSVRIEKSKELIASGRELSDIPGLCGFSDQSYFTKVFRLSEGITPYKYKKEVTR